MRSVSKSIFAVVVLATLTQLGTAHGQTRGKDAIRPGESGRQGDAIRAGVRASGGAATAATAAAESAIQSSALGPAIQSSLQSLVRDNRNPLSAKVASVLANTTPELRNIRELQLKFMAHASSVRTQDTNTTAFLKLASGAIDMFKGPDQTVSRENLEFLMTKTLEYIDGQVRAGRAVSPGHALDQALRDPLVLARMPDITADKLSGCRV